MSVTSSTRLGGIVSCRLTLSGSSSLVSSACWHDGSMAFHPSCRACSWRVVKPVSRSSSVIPVAVVPHSGLMRACTVVISTIWSSLTASHMRRTIRVRTSRSCSFKSARHVWLTRRVGRIAVWPATFLSLTVRPRRGWSVRVSGVMNPVTRSSLWVSRTRVSKSSCVMYWLSVRG